MHRIRIGEGKIEKNLPVDRWGFSSMPREADELYGKYVLARFSTFRNVWWSAAPSAVSEWKKICDFGQGTVNPADI